MCAAGLGIHQTCSRYARMAGNVSEKLLLPLHPGRTRYRAFNRLYDNWPPKLLIADEVGLGKTIQAGFAFRQAWLAGRAKSDSHPGAESHLEAVADRTS